MGIDSKTIAGGSPDPRRWLVLMAIGVGTIMSPLDASVVNIALPVISETLGASLTVVEWVAMAYLLTISCLLLTYGRVGDIVGHRQVYLTGFGVFTGGSFLCGFASGVAMLVTFRVIQALGAGMMMAAGPAILTATFPAGERGRALGLNAVLVGVGLAAGPALGGLLVNALGWRSIFMVNIPIGLVGTWWAARVLLSAPAPAPTPAVTARRRFDVAGSLLLAGALLSVLLALSRGDAWGWRSIPVIALWAGRVLAFILFIRFERSAAEPMVDLSLFRIRLFSAANASALLNFMAQFTVTFLMPFYLQRTLGLPPDRAGIIMLAFPVTMLVLAPLAGSLSDRFGSYLLSPLGMAIVTVGLWLMSGLDAATSPGGVFWRLALIGLGSGLFGAPNMSAIMGSVPRERLGLASGMLATMRNIGMVLGIAISGAVFTARQAHYLHLQHMVPDVAALQDTFMVGAAFAFLGVLAALMRGRRTVR